jgi:hypothetical protein
VLTLYLIFVRDALRLTALSAGALVLFVGMLARLGVSQSVLHIPLMQLALFGFVFLSQKYAGKNIEWLLSLARRKTTLAWYNFALNVSLLAMTGAGLALVLLTMSRVADDDGSRRPFVLQPTRLLALSDLHGRALAVSVFILTTALFLCWNVVRPPDARNFARRQRFLLLAWVAGVMGFVFSVTRAEGALSAALSPLVLFVAGTAAVCLGTTYSTARALGASLRQRRAWMLVGGAIALAEVLVLVTVTLGDLRSGDPSVREQAARLFGPPASPSIP